MLSRNKILFIEPEEDLRIAAKIFLAGEDIFIDTAVSLVGVDFSGYKLVMIGDLEVGKHPHAVIFEKPYTASDLLNTIKKCLPDNLEK